MHHSRPAGVLIGTHRGEQSSDAGADVLTHDDGDRTAIGHLTRRGQRLQNTDGGRGGLNDTGQHCTGQHAQHRVGKHDKNVAELGHFTQAGHRAGHGLHAEHQRGKAQQDHAGVLLLAGLAAHIEQNADERQNRSEGTGLQQTDNQVVALNTGQTQQPCGHRGTHIGAHNHVDRLLQRHKTGVDEADHHNGRGRGGLDHCRDTQARQESGHFTGSQSAQQGFQAAARPLL